MKIYKTFFLSFLVIISLGIATSAQAAVLYFTHDSHDIDLGDLLEASLVLDTEDIYINAGEGEIIYPTDMVELVDISLDDSIFGLWIQEPEETELGRINFIGGTPRGVSGSALNILTLKFLVTGVGESSIELVSGAVTASDGKGTNVLDAVKNLQVIHHISTHKETVVLDTGIFEGEAVPATLAAELPVAPDVHVQLYPEQDRWYNHRGHAIALWDVPDSVIKVAATIDQNPKSVPGSSLSYLAVGHDFGELEDGVWYIHVQFKNNIGWGPVTHYRIAIDTVPPLEFDIDFDSLSSTNPSPIISCHSHDELSGVQRLELFLDGTLIFTDEVKPDKRCLLDSSFVLPPQNPGVHSIVANLYDFAGNSIQSLQTFEILPIASPLIISSADDFLFNGIGFVEGVADPNVVVTLHILSGTGVEIFNYTVQPDKNGKWSTIIDAIDVKGARKVYATSEDAEGGKSEASNILIVSKSNYLLALLWLILLGAIGAASFFARHWILDKEGGLEEKENNDNNFKKSD